MAPPATPSSLAPPGALGRGLAWDPRHGHAQGHGHGGSARKHRCRRPHSQLRSTRPKGGERASVMERELAARDRVGVQDFVLLEDFRSEPAFVDNLRRRFREDLIYTYIGQVLVSVNPYKPLPIYTSEAVKQYRGLHFYEAAPHIFAIADTAYRSLTDENRPQCILISGESGSGKTEASKKVLEFVAEASGHTSTVDNVKDKLLQSNPLLEAFGNAKTNRNDNSSRFGKYMDIAFDFQGVPVGGHILNYLLEKSRVVHQAAGERNFHVFYQLLAGADDALLARLQLRRSLDTYFYCTHGARAGAGLPEHEDATQWAQVRRAMEVVELGAEEQEALLAIVAAVLHLGNVGFTEEEGVAQVLKPEAAEAAARLLGCEVPLLGAALQHRTIEVRGETVTSPLGRDTAIYARDALAKAVYDRLFSWLVARVNASLQGPAAARQNQMGILDIYGFEIFTRNSFEQFCINFCNEKLQQLFIELTLKSEQEEYLREGIEWEPVEYFNNKVICDLIEEKHKGIISLMDEECLRPGDPTDKSFLSKMNANLSNHPHYISHQKADTKTQKIMGRDEFQLKHYAGDVTYNVQGFLDKNNDLLFRDLRHAMSETTNPIIKAVFPASDVVTKRRPDTAATQFKNSLNKLMDILMGKEPSYIRCIKPNDSKSSGIFDEKVVSHQVKYLGLMENLRVRRAGFAFRRPYELFLRRYKCLCPATWPHFNGDAKEGVQTLVNHLNYQRDDFRMGKTKIFIRFPKTLFETEDAFQVKKHQIAAIIQSRWKGRQQRLKFLKMREAVTTINKYVRRFLAKRDAERRRKAAQVIRRFIEGFITRNGPETPINKEFIEIAKAQYLIRLSKDLPKSVLDNRWPPCPISCKEASEHLRKFHKLWLAKKYRDNLKPQDKKQFEMKILAESLFKDKKKSYAKSVPRRFATDRLKEENKSQRQSFELNQLQSNEKILYSASVTKFDRHGYKPRERVLFLTNRTLYLLEGKTSKLKHNLPLDTVHEVVVTTESDNLVLIRIPPDLKKDKGDLILEVDNLIEAITTLIDITKKPQTVKVMDASSISHNYIGGKQGQIEITTGDQPLITKSKGGHLLVVASR